MENKTEEQILDSISRFLKNTTEEYTDFDWDWETLKVFMEDDLIETYTKKDLLDSGII